MHGTTIKNGFAILKDLFNYIYSYSTYTFENFLGLSCVKTNIIFFLCLF